MWETPSVARGFESHSRRYSRGLILKITQKPKQLLPGSVQGREITINHINPDLTPNTGKLVQNQSNYIKRLYKEILEANPDNALVFSDYIIAEEAEINIQESTTETGTKVTNCSFRSASRCS
jgi:hypothetical protein